MHIKNKMSIDASKLFKVNATNESRTSSLQLKGKRKKIFILREKEVSR